MKHINDFRKSFQKTGYKAEVDDLKKIFARKIYDRD